MKKLTGVFAFVLCAALRVSRSSPASTSSPAQSASTSSSAQRGAPRRHRPPSLERTGETSAAQLTGLYRIDLARSDKLYSVVAGASSNLPFGEQQKFFIDLTVRLTPPDLLAIERRGRRITLASSRAPRIDFDADGITHSERGGDGQTVNTLAACAPNGLTVSVSGQSEDKFNVTFEPLEGGRALARHATTQQRTTHAARPHPQRLRKNLRHPAVGHLRRAAAPPRPAALETVRPSPPPTSARRFARRRTQRGPPCAARSKTGSRRPTPATSTGR
jgi:hypothetical protein